MGHHNYLKYVLWALIAPLMTILTTSRRTQTVTHTVVYRPYAFINVVPTRGETGLIFDSITARIRSKTKIDEEDLQTLAYLRDQATANLRDATHGALEYPPLQYIDGSGARIKIVEVWARFAPAGVPTVTIDLGYASDSVDSDVVGAKVAELSQDARDACDALGLRCSITDRLVRKPSVAGPEK